MKSATLIYNDWIAYTNEMPDEYAGKLFKIILAYNNWLELPEMDLVLKVVFWKIKIQIDDNNTNWEARAEASRLNWNLWWRPKKTKKTQQVISKPTRGKPNLWNLVTVTVTDYINIITKKEEIIEHYSVEEVNWNVDRLKVLWMFIEMWYKIENTRKDIDNFFDMMIEKQETYLWWLNWWLLLQKVDTMQTRCKENWVITENHMSRLNKFLSPFKK